MRILKLAVLEPGDVILETGIAAVASATNGPYGHASIALGKLVKIEAGKDEGVVIAPFDLVAYNRNGERLVGMPLRDGDAVVVLRRKVGLDIGEIDGNALWEAGRGYDLHRALDLPDLDAEVKRKLAGRLARRGAAAPDADGRTCSEMAARILGLPASNVSPNALADAEQLEEVEDAIVTLDGSWTPEGTNTATGALVQMVTRIEVGLARDVTTLAGDLAAAIKQKTLSKAAAGEQLTQYVGGKLHEAILALVALRDFENTVLHVGTDKV